MKVDEILVNEMTVDEILVDEMTRSVFRQLWHKVFAQR
jgi:hypothetical protein